MKRQLLALLALALAFGGLGHAPVLAQEASSFSDYEGFTELGNQFTKFMVNNLWVLLAAALVFIMHLGFSTLEVGLTRQKNTVNVLFKNVFIICAGILAYALWGFNAMYPGGGWSISEFFAMGSPIPSSIDAAGEVGNLTTGYGSQYTIWTDFIFQAMFAATAATIVSGAVAERVKLSSFMIFVVLLVTIAYPITGSWQWGGGWLSDNSFYDFAGSSLVHGVGGFAALACVIILGPRKGKYLKGGRMRPIPGHSLPLATVGVFLLWFGWFGFNGGSVLSADPSAISVVFVTTSIAAAAGGLATIVLSWAVLKKPDLSMALNGVLAGLVGITAGADSVSVLASALIGLIAGAIVLFSIIFLDRIRIDDPVGAISVHGVCGIWGTVAVGIFAEEMSLKWQIIGTFSVCGFAFLFSLACFGILKLVMGVRVTDEEEFKGLDITEHGIEAYPNFQQVSEN